jgi:hypothetical protein
MNLFFILVEVTTSRRGRSYGLSHLASADNPTAEHDARPATARVPPPAR